MNFARMRKPKIKVSLIRRREMWAITWEGWVIAIASLIITMTFIITNIHPFLAVNAPIKADILVVKVGCRIMRSKVRSPNSKKVDIAN